MNDWKSIREMPPLTAEEREVLLHAATELPFAGKYWDFWEEGVYLCRQCGAALYSSRAKFRSDCGWPSFDAEIPDAVERRTDPDGVRTEIVCANCKGHLGHVFEGEGFTPRNTRHCVNSLSVVFKPANTALFAGGCFWGVEDFFSSREGVFAATSGYTGGETENPTYQEVCTGDTGHAESVLIEYDPVVVSYRELARNFFEIHDPTLLNYQGPDFGTQYRSAIFYFDEEQRQIAAELTDYLRGFGRDVVTEIVPATNFYPAEGYHQHFFAKNPRRRQSSCHRHREIVWN